MKRGKKTDFDWDSIDPLEPLKANPALSPEACAVVSLLLHEWAEKGYSPDGSVALNRRRITALVGDRNVMEVIDEVCSVSIGYARPPDEVGASLRSTIVGSSSHAYNDNGGGVDGFYFGPFFLDRLKVDHDIETVLAEVSA